MNRLLYAAILIAAVLLLCSCANNSTSINSKMGYVHIQGNTNGVEVYINGVAQTVVFDKTTHAAMILLSPGNYQITIKRNEMDLVNEQIKVTVSNTTEVIVP